MIQIHPQSTLTSSDVSTTFVFLSLMLCFYLSAEHAAGTHEHCRPANPKSHHVRLFICFCFLTFCERVGSVINLGGATKHGTRRVCGGLDGRCWQYLWLPGLPPQLLKLSSLWSPWMRDDRATAWGGDRLPGAANMHLPGRVIFAPSRSSPHCEKYHRGHLLAPVRVIV